MDGFKELLRKADDYIKQLEYQIEIRDSLIEHQKRTIQTLENHLAEIKQLL